MNVTCVRHGRPWAACGQCALEDRRADLGRVDALRWWVGIVVFALLSLAMFVAVSILRG